MLNRNLRQAVCLTLAAATLAIQAPAVLAQGQPAASELEDVIVTGSRLRRREVEGPSPVTVLGAEALEREGFTTVYEAMKSLTQVTGATQDEQYTAGFTPNASATDVRGLGPGRTLILLDGRRITDYPLPYNGESNFVNLTAIPMAAVDRIEVMSGGASAIYGSDAIAGVINIILKKDIPTSFDINVRYGDTSAGGGESQRAQAVGGFSSGAFNLTYAAEYLKRHPISGYHRSFMDSVQDNPNESQRINTRSILRQDVDDIDGDGNTYIDPGSTACAGWPELEYSFRPGRGYYCGRADADAQQTIRNARDQVSLYTRAAFDMGGAELFGSLNYFEGNSKYDSNFDYWYLSSATAPFGFIVNDTSGLYEVVQRFILPSEIGGTDARFTRYREQVFDYSLGLRGVFFGADWDYEATYSHSQYDTESKARLLLNDATDDYFLGPSLGDDGAGTPIYAVNLSHLYSPLTPQIYQSLSAINHSTAESSNDVVSLVLRSDLFQMPAGSVAMAGVLEWGTQEYAIHLDPRVIAGDFFEFTGSGGGGKRNRYALGVEFGVPLNEQLHASLAGRYDKYDDFTNVDDAVSYNLGLEYRPTRQVLLRGSLATSFRAPDMHYVFADPSGYFDTADDEYWCRTYEPGVAFPDCSQSAGLASFRGQTGGNPELEEEKGKSYTFGIALEPTANVSVALDYYHIEISNLVVDYPADRILRTEADCRLGQTTGGAAVDINSGLCQDALLRVHRTPVNANPLFSEIVDLVTTGPINTADYRTSGIDTAVSFQQRAPLGTVTYQLNYTHVLKFDTRDFAGDPKLNRRDSLTAYDDPPDYRFRSKMRGSVTWQYADWTSVLFGERLGSIPRWDETGRTGSHVTWSGSIGYKLLDGHAEVSLFVDNLFNEPPKQDSSYSQYPYFSLNNYDPTGREWFLQMRYKFAL